MRDRDDDVRKAATEALGRFPKGSREHAALFIRALDDPCEWVRCAAADVLATLKDCTAVSKLCEKITDENEYVQRRAIEALISICDETAVPFFGEALDKVDELTRREIKKALVRFGTDEAFAILLDVARRDPSDYGVISAVMYTCNPRAIPVLEVVQDHAANWRDRRL